MDSSGLFKFIKDVTPHDVEHFFTLTILNAEFEDVQNAQDGQAYVGSMYGIVWCHWNPGQLPRNKESWNSCRTTFIIS